MKGNGTTRTIGGDKRKRMQKNASRQNRKVTISWATLCLHLPWRCPMDHHSIGTSPGTYLVKPRWPPMHRRTVKARSLTEKDGSLRPFILFSRGFSRWHTSQMCPTHLWRCHSKWGECVLRFVSVACQICSTFGAKSVVMYGLVEEWCKMDLNRWHHARHSHLRSK